jgi:hypothetical protein
MGLSAVFFTREKNVQSSDALAQNSLAATPVSH